MERFQIQEAIMVLKPLCDALMKYPDVNNARNVATTVERISEKVIQDLLEYILFPLTTHLVNIDLSKTVKEELVKTLRIILLKAKIKKLEYFNRLYSSLLIQIYDKSQPNMIIPAHEELKEAVLSCIRTLIYSCFTEVLESLYTRQHAEKVGQGILLSVKIARTEKSRSLRLTAIETVMTLCQVDDKTDRTDIILQDQVADVITLYLPGIVSGLQEIAMGNEIQGHKVTIMALKAWSRIICLVMQDNDQEETPSLNNIKQSAVNNTNTVNFEEVLQRGIRSPEWYHAAALKLNILVRELEVMQRHSHHKVRRQLAESICLLLSTCSRNMKPNVILLMEYLISLSEDDIQEVREEARSALNIINRNYMQRNDTKPLIELLEENLYTLLMRLPRIVRRSDDNEQLACLNQLAGYIKLLGKERLPQFMLPTEHIRKLLLALVYIIEIDCSNISLLQFINVKDFEDSSVLSGSHLWRQFKYIQNNDCRKKIEMICKLLGQFGDMRILVDSILNLMPDASQHRKELILLLNWISSVPVESEGHLALYKEIVECYVNSEFWYPPIEVTKEVPLRTAQSNVIQSCLLIEGLGLIALNLKSDFSQFLLKTLYLIIEKAGSGHNLISYVGIQSLEQLAESQGYDNVGDLLRANCDYFSYHVTIKLRRVDRNPGVLDVVGVVMKYSVIDVLPCLKKIVEDAIFQMRRSFQQKNSYAFLKVFHIFTVCIRNLTQCNQKSRIETQVVDDKSDTEPETIIQSLLEYFNAKEVDEKIDEELETNREETFDFGADNNETEYVEPEEEKKPDVPIYIQMVEDVINCCLHFLPSKDIEKSLAAMSTLEEGLYILAEWEDRLLPVVHSIWHPLVQRFSNENVLIINRAWQLLVVLARVSNDFIRIRTLKQVIPPLSKFLKDSAKQSYNKSSQNVYQFTQVYKLQVELLSTLPEIAISLKFREDELWNVLSITEQYLSRRQHPVLQKLCIELYTKIVDYNSDIVWVKCLSIWHSKVHKIVPNANFKMEDLRDTNNMAKNEYSKNLEIILKIA